MNTSRVPWPALVLLAVALVAYANSLNNGFHYDDSHSIVENYHLREAANMPLFFVDPQLFSRQSDMAMYRPVVLCTYALNYALGKGEPWGYHLVNIGLHALTGLLVFLLLKRWNQGSFWAWWAGLFFVLHPVHTQAVNYISSRSEILAALGVLGALYWCGDRYPKRGLALVAYGGGLLAKSTALALLPLLALREWSQPRQQQSWSHHLPFWGISGAYVGLISFNGFLPGALAQNVRPMDQQLFNQSKAVIYYAKLLFMPVGLSVEHAFEASAHLGEAAVLASLAVLVSLVFLGLKALVAKAGTPLNWATKGLVWSGAAMGLTFLVPLNVIINEHRLYLASAGVLLALCSLGGAGISRGLKGAGWVLALIFMLLCWQRNSVWQSEVQLWQNASTRAPNSFRALSNLGKALYETGDLSGAQQMLERALQLNPKYARTWNNLGLVYEDLGQRQRAEEVYLKALSLDRNLAGIHNNLGRFYSEDGQYPKAEKYLQHALERDPHYVQAQVNLGLVHHRQGAWSTALASYKKALDLEPDYREGVNNLGLLYADMGQTERALKTLERAVRSHPEYEEARINWRLLQMQQEALEPAQMYEQLFAEFPRRVEVWHNLVEAYARLRAWSNVIDAAQRGLERGLVDRSAWALAGAAYRHVGNLQKAVGMYERAIAQWPLDASLYNNLASVYAEQGRLSEAVAASRQALALEPENERHVQNLQKLVQALQPGAD